MTGSAGLGKWSGSRYGVSVPSGGAGILCRLVDGVSIAHYSYASGQSLIVSCQIIMSVASGYWPVPCKAATHLSARLTASFPSRHSLLWTP